MNKRIRELVYSKYDGHCAYCGKKIAMKDMQVDHLYSKYLYSCYKDKIEDLRLHPERYTEYEREHAKGFPDNIDDLDNLMPACRSCNFRKGEMQLDMFREELRKQAATEMQKRFQARQSVDYGLIEWHDHEITFYFEKINKMK